MPGEMLYAPQPAAGRPVLSPWERCVRGAVRDGPSGAGPAPGTGPTPASRPLAPLATPARADHGAACCPECGGRLVRAEACWFCLACGHSPCG